jgi:UDP-glucose 4-epimerase
VGDNMSVLVTGGAGFIGSNLVDSLIEKGYDVTVWDNFSTGSFENINPSAHFYKINLEDVEPEAILQRFETIFHLGALARIQPSFKKPIETHDANVTGTIKVLEVARKCKAKVVYAGSSSFYHDIYANPYTFTKWIGEEYCKLYNEVYNVPVAIARFFNVYGFRHLAEGPYATVVAIFEEQKKNNKALTVTSDGEQRRDFTNVDDIVDGLIKMSKDDWNGEIFNLGTGRNHSINELAELFNPKSIEYIPKRPGEADVTLADISFTQEKLSWKPLVSIEDYIKDFISSL